VLFQEQTIELYNTEGTANWYQHPSKNLYDVAAINLFPLVERHQFVGANEVATQYDMRIDVGSTVFILGYPLGFTHFANTPIWKSGTIASEPHLETETSFSRVVIDATTRQGMSGSPVFLREKTHYISEKGEIVSTTNASRWIGIYSSRPDLKAVQMTLDEDRRAEVGFFLKSAFAETVITGGIRGPNFGELP
jgi:hypothetical protein